MNQESTAHVSSATVGGEKWLTCNGRQFCKMAQAGLIALEENHRLVNELNVFPVPDGDTGTNMLLTMRAAVKRIQNGNDLHVGKVAQDLSQGALMGARGNSGVILSQIWRGLAKGLKDKEMFNAQDLAAALQEASDTAYKGVMRPVEGTILTVVREAAQEAQDALEKSKDLRFMLARVLERSQQALDRTPDLLPVLKQAGVVDAGGQGLVYILEGMLHYVYGDTVLTPMEPVAVAVSPQAKAAPAEGLEYPYDVQYILLGDKLNVIDVRNAIDAMGDSTVVVGDEWAIKVHVHVKDPSVPIAYGVSLGKITDVVIENMQMQMEEIIGGSEVTPLIQEEQPAIVQPGQIGVVAVAAGDGLAQIFRSLGAAGIVNGGQSNNPSTEEIYQVVQSLATDKVVILPNNKNIILAAEAARDLSPKDVAVVPTRTAPQCISALLSLDRDCEMEEAVRAMEEACAHVASGEIAVATRSVVLHGIKVETGQIIGVTNGRLCASGEDIDCVLEQVLAAMGMDDKELVSIYYGQDVTAEEAEKVAGMIQDIYPDVETEILYGGQAVYQYILGAE